MFGNQNDNTLIILINVAGVLIAYGLLGLSLYLSTEVPLSTKGYWGCLLYTSPSPRDKRQSRMPSSA